MMLGPRPGQWALRDGVLEMAAIPSLRLCSSPRSHIRRLRRGCYHAGQRPLIRGLFDHTSNLRFHRKKTPLWQLSRFPFCGAFLHHLVFYSYTLFILFYWPV